MNDHFTPVGNPAPPRPRNPESFTTFTSSAGGVPSARSNAAYPPRARQPLSVRASASPKYFERTVVSRGCGLWGKPILLVSGKKFGNAFRRDRLDEVFIHHHRSRETTSAEALHLDDGESVV